MESIVVIELSIPIVSVVLTVYNREKYLKRSIDSLLNQSFTEWELIAVDDGSDDDSYDILKEYLGENRNISIIQQKNMKLPLSRNAGIFSSSGRYITFLDSDDEYKPDHLEKRVNYMYEHPEIDIIRGSVDIVGNEYVIDKNDRQSLIHLSECKIGATFFAKRHVFWTLKGFKNIEYSEDSEFWERAEILFNTAKVPFNTYTYHRDDPDSITNTMSRNVLKLINQ